MLSFTLTYRLASVPRFILNVLTAVTDVTFRAEILSLGPCVQFRTDWVVGFHRCRFWYRLIFRLAPVPRFATAWAMS